MTNKDFAIASNKLIYYIFNYPCISIEIPTYDGVMTKSLPSFFEVFPMHLRSYLAGKWQAYYETYGSYGAFNAFYGDIDNGLRTDILSYINEHYKLSEGFGISLKKFETAEA